MLVIIFLVCTHCFDYNSCRVDKIIVVNIVVLIVLSTIVVLIVVLIVLSTIIFRLYKKLFFVYSLVVSWFW